ncbi:metallophosphoesterase [Tautonia sociabilis]|uniref:Metallophosphoesterase n=1 Tax=Tautonia sociabilis TaxID=2080755 RepID=A0A432MCX9_9BACT|nr:metallophosphoesterase [Tautonia sociabilis]RUL81246.1 metallophosphoesterase [Tautonia sociabilis]
MIDWPMLSAIGLGHFCLAVLAVNILHGIGVPEGTPTRVVKVLSLTFLATVSVGMALLVASRPWESWPVMARGYAIACILVGCVGLPATTLARLLRKQPPGVRGGVTGVDLTRSIPRDELIGPAKDSFWLRIPGNQAFRVELSDWEVEHPGLPEPLEGLRILHLTDLHLTRAYSDRFFEAMIEQAEGFEADLIAFTGDLIDDAALLDRVGPLLSRFRGRLGRFAILGNHDYRTDAEGAFDALRSAGFEVVEGRWSSIEADGTRLAIGGTSAPWGPLPERSAEPGAGFRFLLSHSPDTLPWASRIGVDLMLSGHTHGGQYRLPLFGPVLLPSRYSRRYDRGFFRRGPTLMYVSQGIAAQHPIRVNCPAEISRFTLRCAPRRSAGARPHSARESIVVRG